MDVGKSNNKEFTLFRTALWGYSTIMLAFLTIFTLFPSNNLNSGSSDAIAGMVILAPIAIFLIIIVIEHKMYKWNVWKVLLAVYSSLFFALIAFGAAIDLFFTSKMGVSASSNGSLTGLLFLPILAFFVILGYEKFS